MDLINIFIAKSYKYKHFFATLLFLLFISISQSVMTAPELNVSITGSTSVDVGNPNPYSYTVDIVNPITNTNTATNMTIDIQVGTDFSFFFPTTAFTKNGSNILHTSNQVGNVRTWTPNSPLTVAPGDSIKLIFRSKILCNATSIPLTALARFTGTSGTETKSNFMNVEVRKGAVLLAISPSSQTGSADDIKTWTVTATNSGLGDVYNLSVSDVTGSDMSNVTITPDLPSPAFTQVGNTLTTIYPLIPTGQSRSFTVTGKISGCNNLNNIVTSSWPNGASCDTDTATASVAYIPADPGITYSINGNPPPASTTIDWLNGSTVNVQVQNTDPGEARNFKFVTGLASQPLNVLVTSPNWTYSAGTFTYTGGSPVGSLKQSQSSTLSFNLSVQNSCVSSPSGNITFKPSYNDICGNLYEPPVTYISYSTINRPTISVVKSSTTGSLSNLGENFSYNINLSTTNSANISGNITVTDSVPAAFNITSISATGGIPTRVGQNVTWVVPASIANGKILTINVTATSNTCNSNQNYINTVNASATSTNSCSLTSNSSLNTYLQNYGSGVMNDSKIIDFPVASEFEVCEATDNIRYINEYTFDNSFLGTFSGSVFKELMNNGQTFVTGTAEYEVVSGSSPFTNIYAPIPVANITSVSPSLNINLGFLSGNVADKKLRIRYKLYAPQVGQFNDVSQITVAGNSGGCLSTYSQAVEVNVTQPDFGLNINTNTWNNTVDDCEMKNITLDVSKNSTWIGRNEVKLNFNTTNYTYLGSPTYSGFGGLIPTITTSGNNQVFSFGTNNLTAGGSISFNIRKKCGSPQILNSDISWKNRCGTTLNTPTSNNPILNRKGVLALSITPSVIATSTENISWFVNVLNSGDGDAFNVNVNDIMGANLRFENDTGSVLPSGSNFVSQPAANSTGTITWVIDKLAPGKTAQIKVNVKLIGLCGPATSNSANASFGCEALSCSSVAAVNGPVINLLSNNILNTVAQISNIKLCEKGKGKIIIKNSGQANSYNLLNESTLPIGMCYVANSAKISKNGGTQVLFEPSITGQVLKWQFGNSSPNNNLNSFNPLDVAEIEFEVKGDCQALSNPTISTQTRFAKPCEIEALGGIGSGSTGTSISNVSNFNMAFDRPIITSTFTPSIIKAEPGDNITANLSTINSSTQVDSENTILEIVLPSNLTYNSGTTSPTPSTVSGQTISWNVGTIVKNGGSFPVTIGATVNTNGCTTTDQLINANVRYGCNAGGTCSGSSCQTLLTNSTMILRTKPLIQAPLFEGSQMNSCGNFDGGFGVGIFKITFNNDGPSAYNVNVQDTLPAGFVFDGSFTPVITSPIGSVLNTSPINGATIPNWNFTKITAGNVDIRFKVKPLNSGACIQNLSNNLLDINYDDNGSCTNTPNYSIPQTVTPISILKPVISLNNPKVYLNYFTSDNSNIQIISDGQNGIEWEASFKNTGSETLTNFTVVDVVGTSFTRTNSTNGSGGEVPVSVGNTSTWTINSLAPNAVWSAKVTANHNGSMNAADLTNKVTIDGGCPTGCKYQNTIGSGTLPYTETANASLLNEFTKIMSKTSATIGEQFNVTITANLSGNGTGIYTNFSIKDILPSIGANPLIRVIGTPTISDTGGNTWTYTAAAAGNNWTASWSPTTPASFNTASIITINITAYIAPITPAVGVNVVNSLPATSPSISDVLTNQAKIDYVYAGVTYSKIDSKNITVKEPSLTYTKTRADLTMALDTIDSIPSSTTIVGANDIVGYKLTFTNDNNPNTSTAYDINLIDIIPFGLRTTTPVITRVLVNSVVIPSSQYVTTYSSSTGNWNISFLASSTPANNFDGIPKNQSLEVFYYNTVDSNVSADRVNSGGDRRMINKMNLAKTTSGTGSGNEGYSTLPNTDIDNANDRRYSFTTPREVDITTPSVGILKGHTTAVTELPNNTQTGKATIGETVTYRIIFGTSNILTSMFPTSYSVVGTGGNNPTNRSITSFAPLANTGPISGLPISTFLDVIPNGLEVDEALSTINVTSGTTSATPILNFDSNNINAGVGRTVVYTNTFDINPNTVITADIVCRVKNTYADNTPVIRGDTISNGGNTSSDYARLAYQRLYDTSSNEIISLTTGTTSFTVVEPNMTFTKIKSAPVGNIVSPGDNVSYSITASNVNGVNTSRAHELVLNDILPFGMRGINPLTAPGYSESLPPTIKAYDQPNGKLVWIYTNLNEATDTTINYRTTVDANAPLCTPMLNNAQITSYFSLANGTNDKGRRVYSPIVAPPISVYLSNLGLQPNQSIQGEPGSTVTIPHVLNSCTTGSVDLSYISSMGWTYTIHEDLSTNHDGTSLTPALTSVNVTSNVPKYLAIKVQIPSNTPQDSTDNLKLSASQLVNNQVLTSTVDDIVTATSEVSGQLKLIKTVDKVTANPGDLVTYTIVYKNIGQGILKDIEIEDVTPAGTTFQSATGVGTTITSPALNAIGKISWVVTGTLPQNQSGTVTFVVKLN